MIAYRLRCDAIGTQYAAPGTRRRSDVILDAESLDVADVAACLARSLSRGLAAVAVDEPVHTWAGGWASRRVVRLRAPVGVWAIPLDVDASGPWAPLGPLWVRDACRSDADAEGYLAHYRWSSEPPSRLLERLCRCYPEARVADAVVAAVLARVEAPAPVAAVRRPATVQEAADVLGWSVADLRAAVRRGDVRSVAVEGQRSRCIPAEELERLIG